MVTKDLAPDELGPELERFAERLELAGVAVLSRLGAELAGLAVGNAPIETGRYVGAFRLSAGKPRSSQGRPGGAPAVPDADQGLPGQKPGHDVFLTNAARRRGERLPYSPFLESPDTASPQAPEGPVREALAELEPRLAPVVSGALDEFLGGSE